MKKKDLLIASGISQSTLTKMKHDDFVNTEILAKICAALNCDISDIMEMIPEGK